MFDLVYNIDFEIIAFIFAILLYVETCLFYPRHTRKNEIFQFMTIMVIITEGFDIASAFTITYGSVIPRIVNIIINSGYFMSGLFLCYMLHYYIQNAVVPSDGKSVFIGVNKIILIVMEISASANMLFGYYFSFSMDGGYEHGPLYLLMHMVSLWFVLCASAALIINRKLLKKSQIISSFLFVLLYFISVIVQTFILPDVLIIMPAVSAMLIIAIFSLESPDFEKLQKTLKELTETKKELEVTNEKYYKLAYTDLMTGLKNRTAYNIRLEQLNTASFKKDVIFLIADINNLKYLNDNLGHQVGDDAIVKVAKLLKNNFGDGCQCYRIGGDEFAVIAYDISKEAFLENYQSLMEEAKIEGDNAPYPFSIASGYHQVGTLTLLDALKKADTNMYKDKMVKKQRETGTVNLN